MAVRKSRVYTQRHYRAAAAILAAERAAHGASPALNRITEAFIRDFVQDCKDAGSREPYLFDPVLFRRAALGEVPVTEKRARQQKQETRS